MFAAGTFSLAPCTAQATQHVLSNRTTDDVQKRLHLDGILETLVFDPGTPVCSMFRSLLPPRELAFQRVTRSDATTHLLWAGLRFCQLDATKRWFTTAKLHGMQTSPLRRATPAHSVFT